MSVRKAAIYDKLHKFAFFSILGVSFAAAGLFGYNCFLFKRGNRLLSLVFFRVNSTLNFKFDFYFVPEEGVPMLLNKYRTKVEELTEIKQKEAEYFEKVQKGEFKKESESK